MDGVGLDAARDCWLACAFRNSVNTWPLDLSSVGGLCICSVPRRSSWFCFDAARRCRGTRARDHLVTQQHRSSTDRALCGHRISNRKLDRGIFGGRRNFIGKRKNTNEIGAIIAMVLDVSHGTASPPQLGFQTRSQARQKWCIRLGWTVQLEYGHGKIFWTHCRRHIKAVLHDG